ncbi:hypothetical protein [Natronorubrum sp. FCH18a]
MTDANGGRSGASRREERECELCGETVPAAVYREHLLKACPGR